MNEAHRTYPGWWIVFACFWMALCGWGLGFYGLGVYLAELQRARGWSAGLISSAATAYYLAGAVLIAFVGEAVGRFGARLVALAGLACLGAGVAGLTVVAAPWQLFLAYLIMAPGWAALTTTAIATTLAPWFARRRGLAISLALNGASCGGVFVAPALVALTERFGFAVAARGTILALACLLVPITLRILGRRPPPRPAAPAPATASPAGTTRGSALRSAHFWTIAAPFALALLAQVGFLTHQIAFLRPALGAAGSGLAVGVTTALAVIGRVGLGFFIDRLPQRAVAAALLGLQAAALATMLASRAAPVLLLACAAYGCAVGNLITLPSLIVQREYDAASFGTVLGLSTAIVQFTYAFGPGLVGILRDASGGYAVPLALCIACQLLAAGIVTLRR